MDTPICPNCGEPVDTADAHIVGANGQVYHVHCYDKDADVAE